VGRLGIQQARIDDVPVLRLQGDLDLAGVAALEHALAGLEELDLDVLVLDLRAVSFLDSSGLRALLAADARARAADRRLVLVRGPDVVHRVFEIALLDRRLTFVDTPEASGQRAP
jgi:anti-anti-sigma factor